MSELRTIAFLCIHNAGRSQMALGWLSSLGGDSLRGMSGGSEPATQLNPRAVEAMAEIGIDIATNTPERWTLETLRTADVIITMGCGETCPVIPGVRYEDWAIDDPAGQPIETVREIRDEIGRRVATLIESFGEDGHATS